MTSASVPGFLPSTWGFAFANSWPPNPIRQFRLGNVATLNIGDAANGLCGGMSFTTADLFHAGVRPGDRPQPAYHSAQYDYIVDRQITSFDNGVLPLRFYRLMEPTRPARESWLAQLLGMFGVDQHSRTYVMVHDEWPAIRRTIDGGSLAMIGLVRAVSADPTQLGHNHQVLAYGYELDGTSVRLRICDPNWPRDDTVAITFDAGDARGTMTPAWSKPQDPTLYCFFTYGYAPVDPAPFR